MALVLWRRAGQTWHEAMMLRASCYGMEEEVETAYLTYIAGGCEESAAAFNALYDYDLLDFETQRRRFEDDRVIDA